MLPYWFVYIAIAIRVFGGLSYFHGIFKGRAKPNPITWFVWSATAMVAFAAQLQEGIGLQAWVTFSLGITPLLVCITALFKSRSHSHFTPFNISCGILALVGIVLWQVTSNALLAIISSILADACGSIPTIVKGFRHPSSEYAPAYVLSVISMIITVSTLKNWQFASYAFPLYIAAINSTILSAIWIGKRRLQQAAWFVQDSKKPI